MNGLYSRGPLYPLIPLPLVAIMLLNLAGALRRRQRLSRKTFLSLLIAILPMTVTLLVQMFVDVFPLLDISIVFFSLSMFSLILSDQIEEDLRHQREIADQRNSIMVLQMRPHFSVRTQKTDRGSEIVVEDDGRGFDPTADSEGHLALNNIRQRLEIMCGGTLSIEPRDGGGTRVAVFVPPAKEA